MHDNLRYYCCIFNILLRLNVYIGFLNFEFQNLRRVELILPEAVPLSSGVQWTWNFVRAWTWTGHTILENFRANAIPSTKLRNLWGLGFWEWRSNLAEAKSSDRSVNRVQNFMTAWDSAVRFEVQIFRQKSRPKGSSRAPRPTPTSLCLSTGPRSTRSRRCHWCHPKPWIWWAWLEGTGPWALQRAHGPWTDWWCSILGNCRDAQKLLLNELIPCKFAGSTEFPK